VRRRRDEDSGVAHPASFDENDHDLKTGQGEVLQISTPQISEVHPIFCPLFASRGRIFLFLTGPLGDPHGDDKRDPMSA